jgi:solute carrier family 35, member F1/2
MSNLEPESPYLTDEKKSVTDESVSTPPSDRLITRPEIDYSSVGAFFRSTWRRFVSLWTRRFILCLLAGQVVSMCITCTNVTTEELTNGNWQLPTTQTFFLYLPLFLWSMGSHADGLVFRYFSIFLTYTPYTIYKCMPFAILNVDVFLQLSH